jgi:hypothetical protein
MRLNATRIHPMRLVYHASHLASLPNKKGRPNGTAFKKYNRSRITLK